MFVADDKLRIYKIIWLQIGLPTSAPTKQREWKEMAYDGSFNCHASIIRMGGNCIENISSNLFMYLHGGSVSFFLLGKKNPYKVPQHRELFEKEVFTTSSLFIKAFTDASLTQTRESPAVQCIKSLAQ